jgi:hypothetical protein
MSKIIKDVLNTFTLENFERLYYIGTEKRGITIYKQQVRALNLVYCLQKEGIIKEDSSIAIIGGGFAGITASAAALTIGCRVVLIEQKPILLHLQTGCKTRWVHPNIYDWPEEGADFPYAGLPLLDWREGYSSDVSQDIINKYEKITKQYPDKYRELLGASFGKIDYKERRINVTKSLNKDFVRLHDKYDIIILATGFGLELFVEESNSSYWRNDDLDQPYIGKINANIREVVISGTGDGGCIELLRSIIINFHQGRLIEQFFKNCNQAEQLKARLNQIRKAAAKESKKGDDWLYQKFNHIPDGWLHDIKVYIDSQKREDTKVTLIGKEEFEKILSLESMSIFNAFAVYLLHLMNKFEYIGAKSTEKIKNRKKQKQLLVTTLEPDSEKLEISYDVYIVRRGPQETITASLEKLGLTGVPIKSTDKSAQRLWEPGWPLSIGIEGQRVEFVPPLSKAIATTFIEILGETLKHHHKDGNFTFRLTLERFIEINNALYFQQVCRYGGNTPGKGKADIGRIFDAEYGLVGFSAQIGKPVLLKREEDFNEIVKLLFVDRVPARVAKGELSSILCVPILSNAKNGKLLINSILYVDSSEKDFFATEVITTILNACRGFVHNIDNMVTNNEIKVSVNPIDMNRLGSGMKVYSSSRSLRIGNNVTGTTNFSQLCFANINTFDLYE